MADNVSNILIITQHTNLISDIELLLNSTSFHLFTVKSRSQALAAVKEQEISIVIIDIDHNFDCDGVTLTENSGYPTADVLRNSEVGSDIPVILVGSEPPDQRHLEAYHQTRPVAYVTKPIKPTVFLAEITNFMVLQQYKDKYQRLADEGTLLKLELSRRNQQLAISSQVARHISSTLDLDELLHEIVQLIQKQFRYYFVGTWLIASESGLIELRVGSFDSGRIKREPDYKLTLEKENSIITHVCSTLTMYMAQNTAYDPYYMATDVLPNTQAELTLPLIAKGEFLGVIDIQSDRPDVFHPDDVEMLCTIADQTAVAIRNASLYNKVLRASEELEEKIQARTRELQETYHQLELLEQNKSDFIQVLSHELRTPLTLVSGYSELLLTHELADSDPFFNQQVMGVLTGAHRLHELIDSMVDMLKIDSRSLQLMPQRITIESILTPLIATMADALRKRKLTLTMDNIEALPEIEGDLELLGKVFDQLLTNAIKYTPDGGQITFDGQHLYQEFNGVLEEFIEISISDTGIGISPEHLDVIFTKFYRTGDVSQHSSGKIKFKGGGPGLGLSIARGIVEAHQGRIWAESPGYDEQACPGSCFNVLLPITQKL